MEQQDRDLLIRMEESLKHHTENCVKRCQIMDDHINGSLPIRDQVRDNTKFRSAASKALFVVYGAIVTIVGKILFFK